MYLLHSHQCPWGWFFLRLREALDWMAEESAANSRRLVKIFIQLNVLVFLSLTCYTSPLVIVGSWSCCNCGGGMFSSFHCAYPWPYLPTSVKPLREAKNGLFSLRSLFMLERTRFPTLLCPLIVFLLEGPQPLKIWLVWRNDTGPIDCLHLWDNEKTYFLEKYILQGLRE